jgi:hypothetical protein
MPKRGWALRLGAVGLLLAVLWAASPPDEPAVRLCGFHWLTGRPCPLCGLTRALCALAKGRVAAALAFHALSPLVLAMLLSLAWPGRTRDRLWLAGLASLAVYGAGRLVYPAL